MENGAAVAEHAIVGDSAPATGERTDLMVCKPSVPDAEQARLLGILGIDWRKAFPTVKSIVKAEMIS